MSDEQLPDWLAFGFAIEVPDGIYDGGKRQVNDAFLRPKPAELRLAGKTVPEPAKVRCDVFECAADHKMTKRLDRRGTHFVATSDR